MPTRSDAGLRHAMRFVEVLHSLNDLGDASDRERGKKLNDLENNWMQIAKARDWASHNADARAEVGQLLQQFDESGIAIAQIRAETRIAIRRLKDYLLSPEDGLS